MRRTSETGAFSAPRMRTPRVPSRSWRSLHQTASTSDVPLSPAGTPESVVRRLPDVLAVITLLADGDAELTCEPEGPCFALPVRAERAKARERLSSYREPASRNPQAEHRKTFGRSYERAPIRLLPIRAPRQAVLRTSSRLAPSRFTNRPCDLPVEKTRDASNRCLPPKRTNVHPHLVRSQLTHATFIAGTPRGVFGSAQHDWGTGCFTTSETASADRRRARNPEPANCGARAWACCSHGADATEPLTPLSRTPIPSTPHPPSRMLQLRRTSLFWKGWYGSERSGTAETIVHVVS